MQGLYISGVSVVGLAIVGYLLYNKFKKPKQNFIVVPSPSNISHVSTKIERKIPGWNKTRLAGCISEIIVLYTTPNDKETSYIHEYLTLFHPGGGGLRPFRLPHENFQ